ncbi:hypothetical protein QL285_029956 [Trifolium repens]|nr:hypothetical protein QL285_029956 [Trifolium repens]
MVKLLMEKILFLLFWLWVRIRSFMVSYMSIVLTNQTEDNVVNNIMYNFVVAISVGGAGNAIRRMLNRKYVTMVNWKLSLTNLSMVLSCSAVTLFALAMAVTLFAFDDDKHIYTHTHTHTHTHTKEGEIQEHPSTLH